MTSGFLGEIGLRHSGRSDTASTEVTVVVLRGLESLTSALSVKHIRRSQADPDSGPTRRRVYQVGLDTSEVIRPLVGSRQLFVLRFGHPDWVAMQTRQAGLEGTGENRRRELVEQSLRMRPSRTMG